MWLIRKVVMLFSYFYTLNVHYKVDGLKNRLFLFWMERYFRRIGKECHIARSCYFRKPSNISIGDKVNIGARCRIAIQDSLSENAELSIGDCVNIGDDSHISCANRIVLGISVRMGRKVMINDSSHGSFTKESLDIPPNYRPLISKGAIIIEDYVWIGENVIILPNVSIGHNSVIAAGAVVTKSIPPYSLAAGVPAKVIKNIDQ